MGDNTKQITTVEGSKIHYNENAGDQDFSKVKEQFLIDGVLFEDPDFPAEDSSVFYSNNIIGDFEWKRPHEICEDPQFFVAGKSRFDVNQGNLEDCWFLAAVANLTLNDKLFHAVVPEDNSFQEGEYCGAFHFRFWQYGEWVDVVVDDRLPTNDGQLILMRSGVANEFWSALLEKAYAKLHGSYEALDRGKTNEALTDFTGGITELYQIKNATDDLFQIMEKAFRHSSFMGCAVGRDSLELEEITSEGLVNAHAFSITNIVTVPDTGARLLRIRNPWGDKVEWNGAWSDGSEEWNEVSDESREELGVTFGTDGEFWMGFEDFLKHFDILEICHLNADQYGDNSDGDEQPRTWHCNILDGQWIAGSTAGGCSNDLDSFSCNTQYVIHLVDPDEDDENEQCTLLVALMQKNRRALRKEGQSCLYIGFEIYSLPDPDSQPKPLLSDFFYDNEPIAAGPQYMNTKEVTKQFRLNPGTYVVVPSTYYSNDEGEFILRIFTESKVDMA